MYTGTSARITLLVLIISLVTLAGPVSAETHKPEKALIILTSDSLQTRGMAMVLGNALKQQGQSLHILLCDSAGELAVTAHESSSLQPRGMKPEMLMQKMMQEGATVEVCALYLPNSEHGEDDLRDGVSVAKPPAIAEMMAAPDVRVFSF